MARAKTRDRLLVLLNKAGLDIPSSDCFWIQQGGYRHKTWDLACWGAEWGGFKSCWSWSTMTQCVKYGVEISHDQGGWEVSSKMSNEDSEREKAKQREKMETKAAINREAASQRREKRRQEFRIFRCHPCCLQFPWSKGEPKACLHCGNEEIEDVTEDII